MSELSASFWKRVLVVATCFALLPLCLDACLKVSAQTVDVFGDDAADPVRLFERGQSAHARGEIEKALGFYEQALKVRPEFPEAEFQRGNALASLGRLAEADAAFRRAISYKKNWSLPYSALGVVLGACALAGACTPETGTTGGPRPTPAPTFAGFGTASHAAESLSAT